MLKMIRKKKKTMDQDVYDPVGDGILRAEGEKIYNGRRTR
jgi:hypothetical protein